MINGTFIRRTTRMRYDITSTSLQYNTTTTGERRGVWVICMHTYWPRARGESFDRLLFNIYLITH